MLCITACELVGDYHYRQQRRHHGSSHEKDEEWLTAVKASTKTKEDSSDGGEELMSKGVATSVDKFKDMLLHLEVQARNLSGSYMDLAWQVLRICRSSRNKEEEIN